MTREDEVKKYLNQPFAFIEKQKLIDYCWDILSQITQAEERMKELESERDSETHWAKEYFDKWEKAEERVRELEKRQKWIDEVGRPRHPDDERPWVPAYLDCREALGQAEASLARLLEAVERLSPNIEDGELNLETTHALIDYDKLQALYQVVEGIRKEKP